VLNRSFLYIAVLALYLTGCTSPPLPPTSADSPTSPDAAEAPLPAPSKTFAANESADAPSAPDTMMGMHHHMAGMGGDMKGMNMNQGSTSMPTANTSQKSGGNK
jgi:hypothetical protein